MITVKIELWPLGDESSAKEIGRMYIANDGKTSAQDPSRGNYEVAACRRGTTAVPQPIDPDGPKATRVGSVKDYPRLVYNVWRLIARATLACFPEERAPKGTSPVMDAAVVRGLRLLAEHFENDGHNWLNLPTWEEDIETALAWLKEGLQ